MTAHRRIFINPKSSQVPRFKEFIESVSVFSLDIKLLDQDADDVITSAVWSTENNCVTIGSSVLSGTVTTAPITINNEGTAKIKITVETDGDSKYIAFFKIKCVDFEDLDNNDNWV